MDRETLKTYILKNLFSEKGKFCFKKAKDLPPKIVDSLMLETKKCKIDNIKDRIYWIINDIVDNSKCLTCGKEIIVPISSFDIKISTEYCTRKCRMSNKEFHKRIRKDRLKRTGYEHPLQNPETLIKCKETNISRYGVSNVLQNPEIKAKIKENSIEKHGVPNPASTPESIEKRKKTVLKRYGVDNVAQIPEFQERKKRSNLKKYGVENVSLVEKFRQKTRETNLERYGEEYPSHQEKAVETSLRRYGVKNPMQNFHIFQKSIKARFRIKKYVTKSGHIFYYQGYENVVIKFLLEDYGLDESKILTNKSSVPIINYLNPETNKESSYYPDIWVESINLLIEIKSLYTYNIKTNITLEKQAECKRQGFNHLILICSRTKILEMI